MPMSTGWPAVFWVARHGQSAGNVARDAAESAGHPVIDIADRDVDVPLSTLGERQSDALGIWFGAMAENERPTAVFCSPYVRAHQTAQRVAAGFGLAPEFLVRDERLREKEFGILDRLTVLGIRDRHPELAEQRGHVGKFYFRPPGGESWCDVILRLRSFVEMVTREHAEGRVLVVAHQVVVNCLRYLLETLDEATILAIDREADVPNCGVTVYRHDPSAGASGKLVLQEANVVVPLAEAGALVTAAPDAQAAPKP